MQLNIALSQNGVITASLILLCVALCAAIMFFLIYRRFPIHLIYRSKVGFKSMLDAVSEPLAVISRDFTVRRMNKAYIDIIGSTYKTSINAKCYELLRNRASPCEECRLIAAMEENAVLTTETLLHPNGKGAITITFSPYAMPIGSGDAAEVGVIEHIRDISILEKLKDDLERRNNFLVALTRKLRAAQRSVKAELKAAHQIQIGLLPSNISQINRLRVDMAYKAVTDVGGDLYDFIPLSEKRAGVFIGDASGHGLASSLIGTLSKMSLYNHSKKSKSTAELLKKMNHDLKAHINSTHYLTCFWCVFDFEKNKLTYSGAGHPTQLALRKDGTMQGLPGDGLFLGVTEDAIYQEKTFQFEKGDRFFWFTDGIYDVFQKEQNSDTNDTLLGYYKFTELVKRTAGIPFENIIITLKENLSNFKFNDDYTLIVAEVV